MLKKKKQSQRSAWCVSSNTAFPNAHGCKTEGDSCLQPGREKPFHYVCDQPCPCQNSCERANCQCGSQMGTRACPVKSGKATTHLHKSALETGAAGQPSFRVFIDRKIAPRERSSLKWLHGAVKNIMRHNPDIKHPLL